METPKIFDNNWIQEKIDWFISLAPITDVQLIARIMLWSVVVYIISRIIKELIISIRKK